MPLEKNKIVFYARIDLHCILGQCWRTLRDQFPLRLNPAGDKLCDTRRYLWYVSGIGKYCGESSEGKLKRWCESEISQYNGVTLICDSGCWVSLMNALCVGNHIVVCEFITARSLRNTIKIHQQIKASCFFIELLRWGIQWSLAVKPNGSDQRTTTWGSRMLDRNPD